MEKELKPIPEEAPSKERESKDCSMRGVHSFREVAEEELYSKGGGKTIPGQDSEQIAVKINKRSNVLIRGKSSEVLRVANILKNAL